MKADVSWHDPGFGCRGPSPNARSWRTSSRALPTARADLAAIGDATGAHDSAPCSTIRRSRTRSSPCDFAGGRRTDRRGRGGRRALARTRRRRRLTTRLGCHDLNELIQRLTRCSGADRGATRTRAARGGSRVGPADRRRASCPAARRSGRRSLTGTSAPTACSRSPGRCSRCAACPARSGPARRRGHRRARAR